MADAFSKNEVAVCRHYFPKLERKEFQQYTFTIDAIVSPKTSLYQRLADKRLLKPPIFC
jgi:hypothetical protein